MTMIEGGPHAVVVNNQLTDSVTPDRVRLCQINYSSALMLHAHAASQAPAFSRVQTQTSLSSFSFSSPCARMHYNN